ncbi:hypothetical protein [Paraburkholderia sediminicola]|uniref:hypothetical protein n=1 Tax=Paraburkholderia sediminicola TaxID=458836 RepID=UPI0038B8516E
MENFADAAGRHWVDGLVLESEARTENADQLFGIAAECAIKAALMMSATHITAGTLSKTYRTHIDELWDRISANALPKHLRSLPPLLRMENPYTDWSIEQRYGDSGVVSAEALERHKSMAKRLISAVGIVGHRSK